MLDLGYSEVQPGQKKNLEINQGEKKKIEKKYGSSFEEVAARAGKPKI